MTLTQDKKCVRKDPWNDSTKYAFNLDHLLFEWLIRNHITSSISARTASVEVYQTVVEPK